MKYNSILLGGQHGSPTKRRDGAFHECLCSLPRIDFKVFLKYPRQVFTPQKNGMSLTSAKYVVTTVRSANFLPANACNALRAESALSYLTKILPTPLDCLLPPLGRGTFISRTWPYFSHSSLTSSQISGLG